MGKPIENGRVPIKLLHKLNEHTVGGFILFYFNSVDGSPEHVMTFDSPVHALAMSKYTTTFCDAMRELDIEETKNQISPPNPPEDSLPE